MTDSFQAYAERYHAAFDTPEAVVFGMVARATGKRPESRRRVLGATNEVYVVTTGDGTRYLVKIRRDAAGSLATEAWAAARYREAGAPTPEVLLVGTEEQGGEVLEFMVQAHALGRCVAEVLPELGEEERATLWRRAGAVLARMHSVQVGGFGRREPGGAWEFQTWRSAMDAALRADATERPWILQAGFTDRECDEMLRLAARYRDEFDCPQPVLCHSDFIPEHLFVDDELRISAVIDCGDCRGDHPIHDFAAMGDEGGDVSRIAEGYAAERALPEQFEERRCLHWLVLEIGCLALFMSLNHPAAPGHAQWLRRLLGCLLERGW